MLPIIALIVLVPFSAWAAYSVTERENDKKGFAKAWGTVIAVAISAIWIVSLWGSYNTYLDSRAFFSATKEQYRSALTVYKDHATIDIKAASFTDFKYQGYQEQIAGFVTTLRKRVTKYNETIIKKRAMKSNFLFEHTIVAPDEDMVPINLLED